MIEHFIVNLVFPDRWPEFRRFLSLAGGSDFRPASMSHNIRDEPGIGPVVLTKDHCGLSNCRVLTEHVFDFAQFNTMPGNFNLVIRASDQFDRAVITDPPAITGAVNSGLTSVAKWILDEFLQGQFRLMQIASRQARASHTNLTRSSHRDWLQCFIQEVDSGVSQHISHPGSIRIAGEQHPPRDLAARLGDRISAYQFRASAGDECEPFFQISPHRSFAAQGDHA